MEAKRRRKAAVAAFKDMDTDDAGLAPGRPVPFFSPEVEEPDNPTDVG